MLGALAACLGALATAACDPMTDQYFREGAGSDLYSGQLPQATQLQDAYVYYICRQAGNPNNGTPDGSSCASKKCGVLGARMIFAKMTSRRRQICANPTFATSENRCGRPLMASDGADARRSCRALIFARP